MENPKPPGLKRFLSDAYEVVFDSSGEAPVIAVLFNTPALAISLYSGLKDNMNISFTIIGDFLNLNLSTKLGPDFVFESLKYDKKEYEAFVKRKPAAATIFFGERAEDGHVRGLFVRTSSVKTIHPHFPS